MTIIFPRRIGALGAGFVTAFTALVLAATLSPASADVVTKAPIALRSLSFSPTRVDATSGTATVDLTWTLADGSPGATDISGTIYIRREGTQPGTFAGPTYGIAYALDGNSDVQPTSGNIAQSSYRYAFPVPQYAAATRSGFAVVKVTASDDKGAELTVQGDALTRYRAQFAATTLVDTAPPILTFGIRVTPATPAAIYDGDQPAVVSYSFEPADDESGLDTGRLVIEGPDGTSASADFSADPTGPDPACWPDPHSPSCTVKITLPPDAPEGTWRVRELSLTDAAGNTAVITDTDEAPVVVTANQALHATDFAVSPQFVNNWREDQTVQLTLTPSEELSSIVIVQQGVCWAMSTTPTAGENGAVSIPILVSRVASSCRVTGIELTSVTGHVALYGSAFRAPALDLLVQRLPNTTPPVVDSASLISPQVTSQPFSQHDYVVAHVQTAVGVDQYFVNVYDSDGNIAAGGDGGTSTSQDGIVNLGFSISVGMAPGTYTVGFRVYDASGLHADYGLPGSPPVPGGPLVLTVTAPDGQG